MLGTLIICKTHLKFLVRIHQVLYQCGYRYSLVQIGTTYFLMQVKKADHSENRKKNLPQQVPIKGKDALKLKMIKKKMIKTKTGTADQHH